MRTTEIDELFDYNAWANNRVLQAADRLQPEQFIAPASISFGSLRTTFGTSLGHLDLIAFLRERGADHAQ